MTTGIRDFCYEGNDRVIDTIARELRTQWANQKMNANGEIKTPIYVKFYSPTAYKTQKQNSLFHSLLTIYWQSGLSSYSSMKEMRDHFKEIAGLKVIKRTVEEVGLALSMNDKRKLLKQIKAAGFGDDEQKIIYAALRGQRTTETVQFESWAEATKEGARIALDCLINEMVEAGVSGGKFDEIMQEIQKDF